MIVYIYRDEEGNREECWVVFRRRREDIGNRHRFIGDN